MWQLKVLKRAEKTLVKLDKPTQKKIIKYFDEIKKLKDPFKKAKALTGELVGLWRYRIGDYRIICQINNKIITILILDIGHHKEIYKNK